MPTQEAPTTVDQKGSEGTDRHFINLRPPSKDTFTELEVRVINGVNSKIQLASIELSEAYPFTRIAVDFESWYRRPHYGGDYPSREAGYNLKVEAALREPTKIDEEKAEKILELLRASTGKGVYIQFLNGTHGIVIPGKDASRPGHTQTWQDGTTVLGLGIDSMERGVENILGEYRSTKDQWYRDYYAERIAKLAKNSTEPLTSIAISLQSNYSDSKGVDKGENYGLSGWAGNFRPGENQILPFLKNSGRLLEAAARGLKGRNLPPVSIPIELPSDEPLLFGPRNPVKEA